VLNADLLYRKLRDCFNAQEACKVFVEYYAWIEIVMVLYRKMSHQFSPSTLCLLQMFICKFMILFYDSGAQENLKITYNNKISLYRFFLYSHM